MIELTLFDWTHLGNCQFQTCKKASLKVVSEFETKSECFELVEQKPSFELASNFAFLSVKGKLCQGHARAPTSCCTCTHSAFTYEANDFGSDLGTTFFEL